MTFEYDLMIPPMPVPPFETMTEAQAQAHFEWFVGQAPRRVALLKGAYAHEMGNAADLNGTRESLVPLLRWLARHAAIRPRDAAGSERQASLPAWAQACGVKNDELSTATLALAVDAGFYLAQVLQSAHPDKVSWVLWQKPGDHYYNRPVLTGFGPAPLMPHEILETCMWGILHGRQDEQRLMKIHDVWVAKLQRRRS